MSNLEILGLFFMVPGFAIVYLAKKIVNKYSLNEKAVCNFEDELTDEELAEYKFNKAVLNVKIMGMSISLPGLILFLVGFNIK